MNFYILNNNNNKEITIYMNINNNIESDLDKYDGYIIGKFFSNERIFFISKINIKNKYENKKYDLLLVLNLLKYIKNNYLIKSIIIDNINIYKYLPIKNNKIKTKNITKYINYYKIKYSKINKYYNYL